MSRKIKNLPDDDHVMRYVPWGRLRRDEDDNIIGILPEAFQLRQDEDSLSVGWVEFYANPETRVHQSVWALRNSRKAGAKSAFAIGNVGKIKATCAVHGSKVRVLHEPKEGEPAHSGIRRLPRDDLILLAALAEDVFAEMIRNSSIPTEPKRAESQIRIVSKEERLPD
jgi:hypothetical protein